MLVEPLMSLKRDRISFLKHYLLAIIVFVFALTFNMPSLFFLPLIGAALILVLVVYPEAVRKLNYYDIHEVQIVSNNGLFRKEKMHYAMHSVIDVKVNQNTIQQILGYGTIVIGASYGGEHIIINGIKKPLHVASKIETLMERDEQQMHPRPKLSVS
ncbi:MAG: PH domain-containing protein [Nanoarchaeota archaeon]